MMINPSGWSRFVDLLRATGWQAFAVSAGCFLFLLLASTKSFELPSRWIVPIVTLVGIVSGMLAVMSIIRAICEWVYRGVPFVWKFVADGCDEKFNCDLERARADSALAPCAGKLTNVLSKSLHAAGRDSRSASAA